MENQYGQTAYGNKSRTKFTAKDNAKVGGQFGAVFGDVHIYDVGPSALPHERFAKALNLLDGNMPRRAEELIEQAVEGGYQSNKVAYYWALSVLSGRSFDHLDEHEFAALQRCSAVVNPGSRDDWLDALNVVTQFINCLIREERFGALEDTDFDLSIASFDALPEQRRQEIRRHLDLIMTGALQDRLNVKYATEVNRLRMAGDRINRAWKFFEPVPVPPRAEVLTEPQLGIANRVAAVAGAIVAGLALMVMLVALLFHHPLQALLLALGAGGGGYLLITRGPSWLAAMEELAAEEVRHGRRPRRTRYSLAQPAAETAEDDDYTWGESDGADEEHHNELVRRNLFRSLVQPFVDACFADEDPDGASRRQKWREETQGLREALASDIRRRYAGPDIFVSQLEWLITWHAKQARAHWESGSLRDRRAELRAATPHGGLIWLGVVAVVIGVLSGVAGQFNGGNPTFGIGLLLFLCAAGWALYASRIDVYEVQRCMYEAESALAAQTHAEEKAAFDRWTDALNDRPSDAQMARWLDYDKFYAKNLAMNTCGLANRDIVAHAILTEARYPCQRARVLFGPPRYSRYRVIIFLLTGGGVRQVSLDLDFLDGTVSNQDRTNFRYDAIASARVAEVGVRFDSGRRSVIIMDDRAEDTKPPKDIDSLIFSQAFRLSLVDGQHIDVVVENFDHGFLDRVRENIESLFELALDSSGVKGALRILESVAAEGRDWLSQERKRRTRRLLDFSRAFANRRELPWQTSDAPFPELESGDHQPGLDQRQLPGNGSSWPYP